MRGALQVEYYPWLSYYLVKNRTQGLPTPPSHTRNKTSPTRPPSFLSPPQIASHHITSRSITSHQKENPVDPWLRFSIWSYLGDGNVWAHLLPIFRLICINIQVCPFCGACSHALLLSAMDRSDPRTPDLCGHALSTSPKKPNFTLLHGFQA